MPTTKAPTERRARTIPPNVGQGNSHFDSLWYFLARETYRALCRSLLDKELEDVSPLPVNAGHAHDQSQEAAMDWWQLGAYSPWTGAGPAFTAGCTVVDQTAETDYFWAPFILPAGCSRIYPKVRVTNVNAGDLLEIHLRLYSLSDLNTLLIEGGRLGVSDYAGSPINRGWVFFDGVDVGALPTINGVKLGLGLWSANVGAGGQVGYIWQTAYSLKPGH